MAIIAEETDFASFNLETNDGTNFPLNQPLLAAQSSVLKRMFLNLMKEKRTSKLQLSYKADVMEKRKIED